MPELTVVVPLLNEEPNVLPLYEELTQSLSAAHIDYELVLVDDGSTDATFARLRELHQRDRRVRVLRFARNFGQTAAFAAGFAAARGNFIATIDGDLQNDPRDLPRLLELCRTHDIVSGWRRDRKDNFLTRTVPSVAANYLLGVVSGIHLHDNGCSLKVYRAAVVKPLRLRPGMHRYLPALASQLGNRVAEVVVNHRPRRYGRSKYGLSRTFTVLGDLVHLRTLMQRAVTTGAPAAPWYQIAETLD
jgi:glycosyltransferase involved in cell wall biosynthesis